MKNNNIEILINKKYESINFIPKNKEDIACNYCSFELGKCREAILFLGQCYIKEGNSIIKNIYYKEVQEENIEK